MQCCTTIRSSSEVKKVKTNTSDLVKIDPLTPMKSDVKIGRKYWPNTTLESLMRGFTIYNSHCYECHNDKIIQDYDVEAWQVIMRKMGRKAKLIDTTQYNLVYHFILTKREALLGGTPK